MTATMKPFYRKLRAARLAEQYDRLAFWAVRKFLRLAVSDPDFDDAVQEARLCLLDAGEWFDPERGRTFMTYAGRSLQNRLWLWEFYRRRHGFRFTGDSSRKEGAASPDRPINLSAIGEHDGHPFVDALAGDEPDRPSWLDGEDVTRAMRRLPRRYVEVLHARYWVGETLVEAGKRFGVTRGMIHLIEKRAIEKLRHYLGVSA